MNLPISPESKTKHILIVCPNPSIDTYAWLDNFQSGIPNRVRKELRYPGGKGIHVAMALAELGFKVKVLGFWGGESGLWIKKTCNMFYPSIEFHGPSLIEWTRSCYTFKSDDEFDDTEILGAGPSITPTDFENFVAIYKGLLTSSSLVGLSGSWPNNSPLNAYQQLIEQAKNIGANCLLDCTGVQLRNALKSKPYGIHLNRKEITDFYNTSDFNCAIRELLKTCTIAAITDGARGLQYTLGPETFRAVYPIDNVISTIGSGDCLTAGILAGWALGSGPQQTANLGAACGAANCLREELGMLHLRDVKQLLQES